MARTRGPARTRDLDKPTTILCWDKPTAILCSDIHLREDQPACRTDDYWEAQWRKVDWLRELKERNGDCMVLCAGDIFHHWKPSPYLLETAIRRLPKMYVVAGQHDLPQHNLNLLYKSGLGVLLASGRVELLRPIFGPIRGFSWGQQWWVVGDRADPRDKAIVVVHTLVYQKKPWPDAPPEGNVSHLFRKLPGYDLILSGDNHETFVSEETTTHNMKHRLLVNPGSMMRMTADQADHRPCVFLWRNGSNSVEPVYYPAEEGVVSREHIDVRQKREKRMEAFIARLRAEYQSDLNFRENLKRTIQQNKIPPAVADLVWAAMEGGRSDQ